jgi:hypothetical protein
MFNTIGKTLVLINLGLALLALAFAAGIFFQQVDFGWKEPRKNLDQRVPSEIDKRIAAVTEAYRGLEAVQPDLKPAQTRLRQAEDRFGPNHLFYVAAMKHVHSDKKAVKAPEVVVEGGKPKLDVAEIGTPTFGKPTPLIAKSYETYQQELKDLRTQIEKVEKQIQDLTAQEGKLTLRLIGTKEVPGLYGLREVERKRLDQIKFEMEYIRPKVKETRLEADGFLERRADLQATLDSLKKK